MSKLRQTIEARATELANAIVQALRSASLDELMTITGGSSHRNGSASSWINRKIAGGRLNRRSAEDIAHTLGKIVSVLEKHPEGLRAEQIKAALELDTREMPRPIAEGLRSGALKKEGNKRATTYFVSGAEGVKASAKRTRTGAAKR